MTASKEKLWSRDLVLAWVVNFFLAFVFYFLMTTMAVYAVEQFAANETTAGLASSVFVIGSTVARLFAGNLVDLVGKRRILLIALVVGALASVLYVPVSSLGLLLAVRAVHGAAFAIASTAAMALAQSIIPASRRGEGTGYFTLSMTLATAVGPFLGVLLVNNVGYDALFWTAVAASVLAMVLALFLRVPETPLKPEDVQRLRRFHPKDMLHPAVLPVAAFMLVLAICYSGVLTFLNSYASAEGLEAGATAFFLVYAVVMFVTRFFMGRIQDERGDNLVVYIAVAAFAAGFVALGLAANNAMVLLAGALMGLGYGTLMGAMQAIAVSKVPMPRVGVAISTHFFMVDLGVGVGPVVLGLLLSAAGYETMYLVLAGVVVLAGGLYHGVHGRHERARRAGDPAPAGAAPATADAR